MSMIKLSTLGAVAFLFSSLFISTSEAKEFHEITRFNLGGDGGWDWLTVDSETRRLYVARSNRVMVIDADSGKSVGEVKDLDGAHGIALAKELGIGFATSGKSNEVIVFDLKTLKVTEKIKVGEKPDAIVYDAHSKQVLAFNGKSKNASVINAETKKVTSTISLEGKPEFAVSDGLGKVFVNIEDKAELFEIDTRTSKVIKNYSLKPCEEPSGLAMDTKTRRLIVGCGNKLAVIVDAKSGKVIQTFKAGDGVDAAAFDSEHKLAFISAGEGLLTILSEDKTGFKDLKMVPTFKSARTVAVDEKTGHVFLPMAEFKPVDAAATVAHAKPIMVPGTFSVLVVGQ